MWPGSDWKEMEGDGKDFDPEYSALSIREKDRPGHMITRTILGRDHHIFGSICLDNPEPFTYGALLSAALCAVEREWPIPRFAYMDGSWLYFVVRHGRR
ncbi:hypothetical protein [Desulfoplanes sp.]